MFKYNILAKKFHHQVTLMLSDIQECKSNAHRYISLETICELMEFVDKFANDLISQIDCDDSLLKNIDQIVLMIWSFKNYCRVNSVEF